MFLPVLPDQVDFRIRRRSGRQPRPICPTALTAVVQTGSGEISGHILSLNLLLNASEIYISKLKICNFVT